MNSNTYNENYFMQKLTELYRTQPDIHVDIFLSRPRTEIKNANARLVGVYRHIFRIEIEKDGKTEQYSIQYGELSTGSIKIAELK